MSKMKAIAIDRHNQQVRHLAEATLRLCDAVAELKRSFIIPDNLLRGLTYATDDAKGEARTMLNNIGGY